jgi:hypothetical protein
MCLKEMNSQNAFLSRAKSRTFGVPSMTVFGDDSGAIASEHHGLKRSRWSFVNFMPGGSIDVKKAVCAYLLLTTATVVVLYYKFGLKIWSAIIISAIIGQIMLNVIFLPTKMNFWSEFNSYIGIYGMIQLLTPVGVFIYAAVRAVSDKR